MKNSLFRYVCLVVALLICSFADAQQKANYKLAGKVPSVRTESYNKVFNRSQANVY